MVSSVKSWFWPKEVMMFETGSGQEGQAPMAMEVQIPVLKMRMVRVIKFGIAYYCFGFLEITGNQGAFSMFIGNLRFVQYAPMLSTYSIVISNVNINPYCVTARAIRSCGGDI